jgi:hypothetical protein
VAGVANLQFHITAIRYAGAVRKGLIEQASQAYTEGRVSQASSAISSIARAS